MSYDMIDRFLRNNLDDEDYAEFSAALDDLCNPPPKKPLTDEQIAIKAWMSYMDFSLQPEETRNKLLAFARAIEEAVWKNI